MDRETLRKVQLVQLEIAKEVKRVCEENGISYWLDSGTLLGAVRHKGFIPWDDDLDLGMLREDYEKFLQIAPGKLKEEYVLLCWQLDPQYPHQFAKVMKRGTVYREEAHYGSSFDGIFVDVFPYDQMPDEPGEIRWVGFRLMAYRAMIRAKCGHRTWTVNGKFYVKRWLKNLPFRFLSLFFGRRALRERSDRLSCRYNGTEFAYCTPQGVFDYPEWRMPLRYFTELTQLPFEWELFSVPADYDGYLTCAYGDYMTPPPESEREDRHSIVEVKFGDESDTYTCVERN